MNYIIDLSEVKSKADLHDVLKSKLPLPDYYGRNLDAFYDALTEFDKPAEIRFVNVDAAEEAMESYIKSLRKLCKRVNDEDPEMVIIFE